jgi:hypothetical protein
MRLICVNCAKDQVLKDFIFNRSNKVARCDICGTLNANGLDADDPELRSLVRTLVRFHYSEWDYNEHWGGSGLGRLLLAKNAITDYSPHWDQDLYDEILQGFFDSDYEDYDKGVSLFAGYQDEQRLPPLRALKSDYSPKLGLLQKELLTTNHFLLESEVDALLRPPSSKLSRTLLAGEVMFRARIGFAMKARPQCGMCEEWHYKPYSAEQLGAPPPALAGGGRLNRPGVSFLYLASNEDTAICEVRPHPGHYVSVGAFESTRVIRVADFTTLSIGDYFLSDKLLDQYLLLKTIDDLLGLPVVPEDRGRYSLTQFLSDALRRLGFEGVMYRSSVGSGSNVAVFDASSFKYIDGSAKSVQVSQLQYAYSPVPEMGPKDDYLIDGEGNFL